MKILITGGSGFLGKNLEIYFKKHWDEFLQAHPGSQINFVGRGEYSEYSLERTYGAFRLFGKYLPDTVIAMAGNVGGIGKNKKMPATLCYENTLINANTFEYARLNDVKSIYLVGTTCSYPLNCPTPFKEDDLFNGISEPTNRPYSDAKRLAFTMHDAYRDQYGLKGAKLIPANLYGIYDSFDLEDSHVVPAIIRKAIEAKKNNTPLYCWGTGIASRELLHAEDAARAIFMSVKNQLDTDKPINIGTGSTIQIKDLVKLIAELVEFDGEIIFDGSVSDGQINRQLDVSRAKEMLGFQAKVSLKEGLRKTIDWYINHYEK